MAAAEWSFVRMGLAVLDRDAEKLIFGVGVRWGV